MRSADGHARTGTRRTHRRDALRVPPPGGPPLFEGGVLGGEFWDHDETAACRPLRDGRIVVGQFEGDAYRDPATRALVQRVRSETHRPGQFAADNHFGAELAVTL